MNYTASQQLSAHHTPGSHIHMAKYNQTANFTSVPNFYPAQAQHQPPSSGTQREMLPQSSDARRSSTGAHQQS